MTSSPGGSESFEVFEGFANFEGPEAAGSPEPGDVSGTAGSPVRAAPHGRRGRVLAALGALALAGAVTAAGLAAPVPADVANPALGVAVPPAVRTLVCPGALVQPVDSDTGDAAFNPTPVDTSTEVRALTTAAAVGSLTPLAGGSAVGTLDRAGATALLVGGVGGPSVLRAEPVADVAPRVAGVTSSITTAGDLRGLAAASCQQPSADQWLVGGSTDVGNSALLVVVNPGTTSAEISLDLFGPSGAVDIAGAAGFVVAPGAARAVLLEGVAAEQRSIAAHVRASGALVTAYLQDNRLNGFTPAGTDLVSAGTAPATRQVVGGIVVPASAIDTPDVAQLRLLVTGRTAAKARVSLLGPTGAVALPGIDTVDLAPGEVTDLSLGGLPAGAYTAVVDAGEPIVAAAMITRTGLPGALDATGTLERAWGAAADPGTGGVVALPTGVTGTVLLSGVGTGGAATGVLRTFGTDGAILDRRTVRVAAGRTVAIPVASLAKAAVAGLSFVPETKGAAVAWSVLASVTEPDGEFVSVLTPVPDAVAQSSVNVRRATRLGLP